MSPHETAGMEVTIVLAIIKTLVLLVGSLVTYFAFKAYRRTGQQALGLLASGFGIITLGLVSAGVSYELLSVPLAVGIIIESTLVLVGFIVIAYSLYVQ